MQRNDNDGELKLTPGEKLWPETISFGEADGVLTSFRSDDAASTLETLGSWFYHTAKSHGFWDADTDTSMPTKLLMVVGEVSEAFEAIRDGNPPSEKIPGYSCLEEELADIVIRTLGDAAARDLDVMGAIIAKGVYNVGRPHKHGKVC
jgi:NTP pyrophosphatase (non-canonical NTP hydrolase)